MENHGTGKRQAALGDVERQGSFSNSAGSGEAVPKTALPSLLRVFSTAPTPRFPDSLMPVTLLSPFAPAALLPATAAERA